MDRETKKQKMSLKKATVIQFASKYINIAVQLLITAVLARLVSPEDFGILAIVTVFSAFFMMISDMGIGVAVIQYQDLSEKDYGSLFGFSIILSVLLSLVFCLASFPIAVFYTSEILIPLCCFTSLGLLFSTLNMVPNGLMLKEKRFFSIGIRLIVASIISGAIAIVLAVFDFGVYALAAQIVLSSAIILCWNVFCRPIRSINFHFMSVLKKVFSYSAYQFGFNLINYFSRNMDNLLIGKILGTASLGYYDKAYKLTSYPMTAFSSVIASVIQPFMAVHQNNLDIIFSYWFRITKFISLVAAPVAILMYSASEEIVLIMYGDQWLVAVPILRILSLTVFFQMLANPTGAFFQSTGRTDLMFRVGLINSCLSISGLLIGIYFGSLFSTTMGVAIGLSLGIIPCFLILIKGAFKHELSCLKVFIPEIAIGLISLILWSSPLLQFNCNILVSLVLKALLVSVVFFVAYWITGQFKYFRSVND